MQIEFGIVALAKRVRPAPQFIRRFVRHRADAGARGFYNPRLDPLHISNPPRIPFKQGSHSSDIPVDVGDDDVAWDEAAMACSDMIRDTIARLRDGPEWRLEVADDAGTIRHLFGLTAETFDP